MLKSLIDFNNLDIFPFATILHRSQSGGKIQIQTFPNCLGPAQDIDKWEKSL